MGRSVNKLALLTLIWQPAAAVCCFSGVVTLIGAALSRYVAASNNRGGVAEKRETCVNVALVRELPVGTFGWWCF